MTTAADGAGGLPEARRGRRHRIVPHTADAGLRVVAPSLAALFEEAAVALSALTADRDVGARPSLWEDVRLEAGDLPGLAYAWLNELVALGDVRHAAILETSVVRVDRRTDAGPDGAWRIHARIGLAPYGIDGPRPRRGVKSATFHRLAVEPRGGGWTMRAYLDV